MATKTKSASAQYKTYLARCTRIGASPKYGSFDAWAAAKLGQDAPVAQTASTTPDTAAIVAAVLAAIGQTPEAPVSAPVEASQSKASTLPKGFGFGREYVNGKGETRLVLMVPAERRDDIVALLRTLA